MITKTRLGVVAALTGALVAVPAVANAGDVSMYSTSGRSHVWYDDSGNRVVVCDMVNGDGYYTTVQVWDWVYVNGQRVGRNGSEVRGFYT